MTEAEIRDAIVNKLSARSPGRDTAFIAELHVDGFARRADLVVAGATLAAYEIKTSRDSLARLPGQLQSYGRFFEQVTVVCAQKHVDGVLALADEGVGVWVVTATGALRPVRRPRRSALADKASWLSFLPLGPLRALCRSQGLRATGSREEVLVQAGRLALGTIRLGVLEHLKQRAPRVAAVAPARPADPVLSRDAEVRRFLERLRSGRLSLPVPAAGTQPGDPAIGALDRLRA